MSVGVLAPLQVRVGGCEVGVGGKGSRVLLSRLVLPRGATVSAAELVEHVRGEEALDAGGTSLHPTTSRLRRVLEPEPHGRPERAGAPRARATPCTCLPGELLAGRIAVEARGARPVEEELHGGAVVAAGER